MKTYCESPTNIEKLKKESTPTLPLTRLREISQAMIHTSSLREKQTNLGGISSNIVAVVVDRPNDIRRRENLPTRDRFYPKINIPLFCKTNNSVCQSPPSASFLTSAASPLQEDYQQKSDMDTSGSFPDYLPMNLDDGSSFSDSETDSIQPSPVVLNQNADALFTAATMNMATKKLESKTSKDTLSVPYLPKRIVKGPRDASFDFTNSLHGNANNNAETIVDLTELDDHNENYEGGVFRSGSERLRMIFPGSGGNYKSLTDNPKSVNDSGEPQTERQLLRPKPSQEPKVHSRYYESTVMMPDNSSGNSGTSSSRGSSDHNLNLDTPLHMSSDTTASTTSATDTAARKSAFKTPKSPVKKSSTTFSKQLVFSKEHDIALFDSIELGDFSLKEDQDEDQERGAKYDESIEEEERDVLLPLGNLKREPTYRARRRSIPLSGKVMTKSEFENYRKSVSVNDLAAQAKSAKDLHLDEDYASTNEDNEDDNSLSGSDSEQPRFNKRYDESAKDSAKMRQKQDAHLSVYRQQMSKIIGGTTMGGLPRPRSTIGLSQVYNADDSGSDDDEYDNVPLGILKAHGFPTNAARHKSASPDASSSLSNNRLSQPQRRRPESLRSSKSAYNLTTGRVSPILSGSSSAILPASLPQFLQHDTNKLGRGLVGEIAREEEAKMMRKSLTSSDILAQSGGRPMSSVMAPSVSGMSMGTPSVYGLPSPGSRSTMNLNGSVGTAINGESQIQSQLQQMMQIQMQMLEQMQHQQPLQASQFRGNPAQQVQSHSEKTLSMAPSMPALNNFSIRPVSSRASMRSFSNVGGVSAKTSGPPENRSLRGSKSQMFVRPNSGVNAAQLHQQPVLTNSINETSDEDEDEDAAWESMLQKRRLLKESWAHSKSTAEVT